MERSTSNHFSPLTKMAEILWLLFFLFPEVSSAYSSQDVDRWPYIAYLGDRPESQVMEMENHQSLLHTAIGNKQLAKKMMIHSYVKSFNAFAAKLLPGEAKELSGFPGVVSVFPSTVRKLHTTRSWDFLGLTQSADRKIGRESDIVVGMLDTGIWPDSPSFNDEGLGSPPSTWRGKCVRAANFSGCNNKIVGAKFFRLHSPTLPREVPSPLDTEGHGTHTSSTVAGSLVQHASLYGLAGGTVRGGVPSARIAMYKVCWSDGCHDVDILAALDEAISDGVDVLSLSLGQDAQDYFLDTVSIGAFHAMKKGIVTSVSAGNGGPASGTVQNISPWMITVGASSIDRQFRTKVELGDGRAITGISVNTFSPAKKLFPLISGGDAGIVVGSPDAASCFEGYLDKNKVKGKIVYCDGVEGEGVKPAGGSGAIKQGDGQFMDVAFTTALPEARVGPAYRGTITKYLNSTRNPQAVIYKSHAVNVSRTFMTSFSSRGPNRISQNILKPDIAAPGLDILAAYSQLAQVTDTTGDIRVVNYNILSGTSMACPHVTAVAAYVKTFHPAWSPAAIKSAIMTTAKELTATDSPDAEFGYGSGLVDPVRALDPGLVYDADELSYIRFLCKEGYFGTMISLIIGSGPINCSTLGPARGSDGLNYPSMQYPVKSKEDRVDVIFYREVTNVGQAQSVYHATVRAPEGLSVKVVPSTLVFDQVHRKRSFKVVVKSGSLKKLLEKTSVVSASLSWSDSKRTVRSPIVIYIPLA